MTTRCEELRKRENNYVGIEFEEEEPQTKLNCWEEKEDGN